MPFFPTSETGLSEGRMAKNEFLGVGGGVEDFTSDRCFKLSVKVSEERLHLHHAPETDLKTMVIEKTSVWPEGESRVFQRAVGQTTHLTKDSLFAHRR